MERVGSQREEATTQRDSIVAPPATAVAELSEQSKALVQHHLIRWAVPLSQFQVETKLFRPKPTLYSPIMAISTGAFSLDWQLSLAQQQTEAEVELHYKSTDIPNQGVQYTVFAARKDGTGRVRLNLALRRALAQHIYTSLPARLKATLYGQVIQDDSTIQLEVVIQLAPSRWAAPLIIAGMIKEEREKGLDYADGTLGTRLWAQVSGATADSEAPAEADVTFLCPQGRRVYAHKAVVAAFCDRFASSMRSDRKAKWSIQCDDVSSEALWEVLHFVYLRKVSATLHRAPLAQVLEAARLFQQPRLLSLEVERLLLRLLPAEAEAKELRHLFILGHVYRLPLLLNASLNKARGSAAALRCLRETKASLVARDSNAKSSAEAGNANANANATSLFVQPPQLIHSIRQTPL